MIVTYNTGFPIHPGDLVRRSPGGKAVYTVAAIVWRDGEPIVWLSPHSGFTGASAFGHPEIARLVRIAG